ncbi:MAG: molybdopterin-guanine dinucleotide biosynthesis protein B [Desulfobulbaceae bacterium A2]|nr:MAG: molybdopterin-guanine dinucleotide biosynthesis protein B [Desulfobulbaceae bacterium A2]
MQGDARASAWIGLVARLPVLGICGVSGAGKTTLIEGLIPELCAAGLRVTVVKHGARRVTVDRPGKDSERFFRAGAEVCLWGEERFCRCRGEEEFLPWLARRARSCDILLVEGHAATPVPKLWLLGPGHQSPPPGAGTVLAVLSRDSAPAGVRTYIAQWLPRRWLDTPVWGCVLLGGRSRRMGRPKHLIRQEGRTWLERGVELLMPQVEQVVLSGAGELPAGLAGCPRVPDLPGEVQGPMAGLLALMRWNPWVSWLPLACDQPQASPEALAWLLAQRRPGVWGILPALGEGGWVEPLLAHYDFRLLPLLEDLAASGSYRPGALAGLPQVASPVPPPPLRDAWRNINRPTELPPALREDGVGDLPGGED